MGENFQTIINYNIIDGGNYNNVLSWPQCYIIIK